MGSEQTLAYKLTHKATLPTRLRQYLQPETATVGLSADGALAWVVLSDSEDGSTIFVWSPTTEVGKLKPLGLRLLPDHALQVSPLVLQLHFLRFTPQLSLNSLSALSCKLPT